MSFERDSENGEGCISVQVGRSTGPFSKRHRRPFVRDPPCRARGIVGPVGTMRACRMHPDLRFLRSTTASWSSSSRAFEGHPPQATHLENPGKAGTALCGSKSWRPTHRAPHRALSPPGADRARWSGLYGSKPCGVPAFPGFSRTVHRSRRPSKILEFFTLGRWARGGPASVAGGRGRVGKGASCNQALPTRVDNRPVGAVAPRPGLPAFPGFRPWARRRRVHGGIRFVWIRTGSATCRDAVTRGVLSGQGAIVGGGRETRAAADPSRCTAHENRPAGLITRQPRGEGRFSHVRSRNQDPLPQIGC